MIRMAHLRITRLQISSFLGIITTTLPPKEMLFSPARIIGLQEQEYSFLLYSQGYVKERVHTELFRTASPKKARQISPRNWFDNCPIARTINTGGAAPSYTPAAPGLVCLCSSSRSNGKDTPSAGALQGAFFSSFYYY